MSAASSSGCLDLFLERDLVPRAAGTVFRRDYENLGPTVLLWCQRHGLLCSWGGDGVPWLLRLGAWGVRKGLSMLRQSSSSRSPYSVEGTSEALSYLIFTRTAGYHDSARDPFYRLGNSGDLIIEERGRGPGCKCRSLQLQNASGISTQNPWSRFIFPGPDLLCSSTHLLLRKPRHEMVQGHSTHEPQTWPYAPVLSSVPPGGLRGWAVTLTQILLAHPAWGPRNLTQRWQKRHLPG